MGIVPAWRRLIPEPFAAYVFLMWERACSRKRHQLQHECRLIGRFREQARSHSGFMLCQPLRVFC
ncbi:hypothetical protein F6476_03320 [Pseudomonas umsongensis]|nr:hypothetical protein F6476_03320 [Pseudomonas umsongensis]